jgi:hypothetical protein
MEAITHDLSLLLFRIVDWNAKLTLGFRSSVGDGGWFLQTLLREIVNAGASNVEDISVAVNLEIRPSVLQSIQEVWLSQLPNLIQVQIWRIRSDGSLTHMATLKQP